MRPVKIALTPEERHLAVVVGSTRHMTSTIAGRQDNLYNKPWWEGLTIHVLGCLGEIAVSKAVGINWPARINRYKAMPDIGEDIEVRHRADPTHDLIIRKNDDDNHYYFLTTGAISDDEITVVGFIRGINGKLEEFLANHGGYKESYFVPQVYLNPVGVFDDIKRERLQAR